MSLALASASVIHSAFGLAVQLAPAKAAVGAMARQAMAARAKRFIDQGSLWVDSPAFKNELQYTVNAIASQSPVLASLLPQFLPVFQALEDLALEATLDRLVELLTRHPVGKVALAREALLGIVVVFVAAAVAQLLHELGRRVEDMHRRRERAVLLGRALGGAEGGVARIRFRRRAE